MMVNAFVFYFPLDTNREGENMRWGKKRNSKKKVNFQKPKDFFFEGSDLLFLYIFCGGFQAGRSVGKIPLFFYGMLMFWVEWSVEEKG
jgi:hypothetical protein